MNGALAGRDVPSVLLGAGAEELLGAGAGELLGGAKLCGRAAVDDGGGGAGVDVPNGGARFPVSSCARE